MNFVFVQIYSTGQHISTTRLVFFTSMVSTRIVWTFETTVILLRDCLNLTRISFILYVMIRRLDALITNGLVTREVSDGHRWQKLPAPALKFNWKFCNFSLIAYRSVCKCYDEPLSNRLLPPVSHSGLSTRTDFERTELDKVQAVSTLLCAKWPKGVQILHA